LRAGTLRDRRLIFFAVIEVSNLEFSHPILARRVA
jgi:hypothetical protein